MKKKLLSVTAYLLLVLGTISMLSPIPGGVILLAAGLTLLICTNPSAQFCLKWIRTKVNWFNKSIFWLESKVELRLKVMGDALKLTRPSEDENYRTLSHKDYVKKNLDTKR